jgi:hypothetical protein
MTFRIRRLTPAAVLLVAAAPAFADERDTRIERLEKETAELKKELAAFRAERGAPSDVTAVRAAVDEYLSRAEPASGTYAGPGDVLRPRGRVMLGGYFSTQYVASQYPGENPTFVALRLVPQLHADITSRIAFNAEIEFEDGGITDEHAGEIAIEYAELSFRHSPAFAFKAGQILIPFGQFNQNHDDPLNELPGRPTVARFIVPSAFAGTGVGAMGALPVAEDTSLTYDVALTNGFSDNLTQDEGLRTARNLVDEDDNHDKTVFGRVGLIPTLPFLDAVNVGASGAFGKIGEDADPIRGYGVDASGKHGPWEFKGEYDQFEIDTPHGGPPPIDSAGRLGPIRGLHGWYAQLLYRFTEDWVRCLPFSERDASVALVVRRDSVDLNDRVHGASDQDDERAWTFGVTYRPTSRTAVKVSYRIAESGADGDAGSDRNVFAVEFSTYF